MSVEKKPLKVLSKFFKQNQFAPVSGLSNEVLCTLVAQATAKLPEVKLDIVAIGFSLKKSLTALFGYFSPLKEPSNIVI